MFRPRLQLDNNGDPPESFAFWTIWYALTLGIVLLVPSYARFSRPIWALPTELIAQFLVAGVAYLALVLFLRVASGARGWVSGLVALAVCTAGAALLLTSGRIEHSRIVMVMLAALGVSLAALPFVLVRRRTLLGTALVLAAAVLLAGRVARNRNPAIPVDAAPRQEVLVTALHAVTVAHHAGLIGPTRWNGGAISALGKGFLLVTGSGEFYRLDWAGTGDSLRAERLPVTAPLDLATFDADFHFDSAAPRLRVRVTDLMIDTLATPARVLVTHQFWRHDQRCFTMRLSSVPVELGDQPRFGSEWKTLFETQPCLSPDTSGYDDSETGGRLAWGPGKKLLMSVGQMGLSGRLEGRRDLAASQRKDSDYGKILLLDGKGGRQIFSLGHRNPQGLVVDASGRIWETEHGPQGGDEINAIVQGGNYGWPFATYGTLYGLEEWPFSTGRNHGDFREPATAFVPSIGISSLIQVEGKQFPNWAGDLLVASLRARTLFRTRTRDDRVIYTEPIVVDRRIRDLAEGSDGRIVLWNDDDRELTSLSLAPKVTSGEAVYNGRCFGCHELMRGTNRSPGPLLNGVVGRAVASQAGYPYSSALRAVGGAWTKDRLDKFLRDPAAFAPGSPMVAGTLPDSDQRRAVIDYLAQRK